VGAAIVIGVKLVTPLAMAGTRMPPLAAAGWGMTQLKPPVRMAGQAE